MPEITPSFVAPTAISRRSIAKAAAWSVPVVAMAAATPLAAASTTVNNGFFVRDVSEPTNVPADGLYREMTFVATDRNDQPLAGGTITLTVTGAGKLAKEVTLPVVNGNVVIPRDTIQRTVGDSWSDIIMVSGRYSPADGSWSATTGIVTLPNRDVVKLYHIKDSTTPNADWELEPRPLAGVVFQLFYLRARYEAGPSYAKLGGSGSHAFTPQLDVNVSAVNGRWAVGGTQKNGVIRDHNGHHALPSFYQDSTSADVVVTGYADYTSHIAPRPGEPEEKRRANIRLTWPTRASGEKARVEIWQSDPSRG